MIRRVRHGSSAPDENGFLSDVDNTSGAVYNRSSEKHDGVLDTSFWTVCCNLGIDAYLYDFFNVPLWIPSPVLYEITENRLQEYVDVKRLKRAIEDKRILVP